MSFFRSLASEDAGDLVPLNFSRVKKGQPLTWKTLRPVLELLVAHGASIRPATLVRIELVMPRNKVSLDDGKSEERTLEIWGPAPQGEPFERFWETIHITHSLFDPSKKRHISKGSKEWRIRLSAHEIFRIADYYLKSRSGAEFRPLPSDKRRAKAVGKFLEDKALACSADDLERIAVKKQRAHSRRTGSDSAPSSSREERSSAPDGYLSSGDTETPWWKLDA